MKQHGEHIPCDPTIPCKYRTKGQCFEDIDHIYGPRDEYRTKLERAFRNHVLNKILRCRQDHENRHATEPFPQKPTVKEMRAFLYE